LPPDIVAAFRATLEEITEADMLLNVVDATHPNAAAQMESVADILAEMEIDHMPSVIALNKVDLLSDGQDPAQDLAISGVSVPISALTGQGIETLLLAIEASMEQQFLPVTVMLPYDRGDLTSLFHERGQVNSESHSEDGTTISGRLPHRLVPYFQDYKLPRD
jgi:GTP-binding protein HflX